MASDRVRDAGAPYHVGLTVPNLEEAMDLLGHAVGTRWTEIQALELPDGESLRYAFSFSGPPYIELCEGTSGTPWANEDGIRFHHMAYWTSDFNSDAEQMNSAGAVEEWNAEVVGRRAAYFRLPGGDLLELVDVSRRPDFERLIASHD